MYKIKCGGIYIIECGDYYYIGKSVNIFDRWGQHYTALKQNKHSSSKLQAYFNEFGVLSMKFKVLEYVSLTEFKKSSKIKGKAAITAFNRHLLMLERKYMKNHSINFALNADNKYFS